MKNGPLVIHFVLTYAISWAFMLPVALSAQGLISQNVPYALYYLASLGIPGVLGVWFLTYGMGEEIGWRGFALPHLQRTRPAATAAVLLGVLWALSVVRRCGPENVAPIPKQVAEPATGHSDTAAPARSPAPP